MRKLRSAASLKEAAGLAALVACAAFTMLSTPAPLQGQCKIVPRCDWCSCIPNDKGEHVCQCYNCTLTCQQQ